MSQQSDSVLVVCGLHFIFEARLVIAVVDQGFFFKSGAIKQGATVYTGGAIICPTSMILLGAHLSHSLLTVSSTALSKAAHH